MLICLEGIDASGKSSLAKMLAQIYNGVAFEFPDYNSFTGQQIDALLRGRVEIPTVRGLTRDKLLQSLMILNRLEVMPKIEQEIKAGKMVFLSRYWPSGVAYAESDETADFVHAMSTLTRKPDIWVFLRCSVETSFARRPERTDALEACKSRLEGVVHRYEEMLRLGLLGSPVKVVDAGTNFPMVLSRTIQAIEEELLPF